MAQWQEAISYFDAYWISEPQYSAYCSDGVIHIIPPVVVHTAIDECCTLVNDSVSSSFFTPGTYESWDKYAVIDDFNVEFIKVHGWTAWYSSTPGTYGYQIDENEPIYSDSFAADPEEGIINALPIVGGASGTRMNVLIPVQYLSGEHTIKVLAKDANGTVDILTEFQINKESNPDSPVVYFGPQEIANAALDEKYSNNVDSAYVEGNGTYVDIHSYKDKDPYFYLIHPNFNNATSGARYVAIKYRSNEIYDVEDSSVWISANSEKYNTGVSDRATFYYQTDDEWHLIIIDLEEIEAVNESYDLRYLSYTFVPYFATLSHIDIAYVATFQTVQAAEKFFSEHIVDDYVEPEIDPTFGTPEYPISIEMAYELCEKLDEGEVSDQKFYIEGTIGEIMGDYQGDYCSDVIFYSYKSGTVMYIDFAYYSKNVSHIANEYYAVVCGYIAKYDGMLHFIYCKDDPAYVIEIGK